MSFVASLTAQPETPAAAQFGADAGGYQAVSAGSHAVTETVNTVTVS